CWQRRSNGSTMCTDLVQQTRRGAQCLEPVLRTRPFHDQYTSVRLEPCDDVVVTDHQPSAAACGDPPGGAQCLRGPVLRDAEIVEAESRRQGIGRVDRLPQHGQTNGQHSDTVIEGGMPLGSWGGSGTGEPLAVPPPAVSRRYGSRSRWSADDAPSGRVRRAEGRGSPARN